MHKNINKNKTSFELTAVQKIILGENKTNISATRAIFCSKNNLTNL